ncbi:hypothetical protein LY76DRAFT_41489 [Colletotrichum caudatum]|nr:hypothetical protein LY76DRAFT_41489 [Colletotrichum caudatum]
MMDGLMDGWEGRQVLFLQHCAEASERCTWYAPSIHPTASLSIKSEQAYLANRLHYRVPTRSERGLNSGDVIFTTGAYPSYLSVPTRRRETGAVGQSVQRTRLKGKAPDVKKHH